jgi:hypothetical protein
MASLNVLIAIRFSLLRPVARLFLRCHPVRGWIYDDDAKCSRMT